MTGSQRSLAGLSHENFQRVALLSGVALARLASGVEARGRLIRCAYLGGDRHHRLAPAREFGLCGWRANHDDFGAADLAAQSLSGFEVHFASLGARRLHRPIGDFRRRVGGATTYRWRIRKLNSVVVVFLL